MREAGDLSEAQSKPSEATSYVKTTQADGRLLLRFIARRSDRMLTTDAGNRQALDCAVLFEPAEAVAADPQRAAAAMGCVDALGFQAAPANVRSIRLTSTYLGIGMEDGEPPPGIKAEVRRIRAYLALVGALAVLLLCVCVGLLAHMEAGRRLLTQVKELRSQEALVRKDMSTLALGESAARAVLMVRDRAGKVSQHQVTEKAAQRVAAALELPEDEMAKLAEAAPLCGRQPSLLTDTASSTWVDAQVAGDVARYSLVWWREPGTPKAAEICRQHDDNRVRLALLYVGMADWNCRSHRMFALVVKPFLWLLGQPLSEAPCGAPSGTLPPEVGIEAWQAHESRVATTSSVVSGFLLPLLLGSLGGCAYAMRRIDQKLSNWTLEPQDGRHAVVRVALAAVLGGLVGVVWTGGESLAVGGFSLSLSAAAFFIGFSVEPVFRLIETVVIEGVLKKMAAGKETPAKPG